MKKVYPPRPFFSVSFSTNLVIRCGRNIKKISGSLSSSVKLFLIFFFEKHARGGSKNYFFTLDRGESLIFFMYLPHPMTKFMLKETEKKGLGG